MKLFGALLFLSVAWGLAPRDAEAAPVCFYQHSNYAGLSMCRDVGNYSGMPTGWNDYVSSLTVQSGYKVELYEHGNYGGVKKTFTSKVSSLVSHSFNDKTSSFKITKSGTCPAWVAGKQYYTGDVVVYNSKYYIAEHDNPGYDPVVSTWYWDPTSSCPSGGGSNTSGFESIMSSDQFNQIFPNRNSFYTYAGLVNAANAWGAFAGTGDLAMKKREAAAAMANFHHETGGLVHVVEQNTANYCHYCDTSQPYGCPAGACAYYGRGPIQLSWNFNYKAAGDANGINLLNDPNQVQNNATTAWKTALWYWMTQKGPGTRHAHDCIVGNYGFGCTIRAINGALECDGKNTAQVNSRIEQFTRIKGILGGTSSVGPDGC